MPFAASHPRFALMFWRCSQRVFSSLRASLACERVWRRFEYLRGCQPQCRSNAGWSSAVCVRSYFGKFADFGKFAVCSHRTDRIRSVIQLNAHFVAAYAERVQLIYWNDVSNKDRHRSCPCGNVVTTDAYHLNSCRPRLLFITRASVGNFKKVAPGSSVTCPVGATYHQRASVSAASSFCFRFRQVHDICRHVFAAQDFRRDHSASSASSTFHAAGRAVARNVPAALACGFLVDRWALLRLCAGNNRNLTSLPAMSDSRK